MGARISGSIGRTDRMGPTSAGTCEWNTATKPGHVELDDRLPDHVGLLETGLRPRHRGVLDLHRERRAGRPGHRRSRSAASAVRTTGAGTAALAGGIVGRTVTVVGLGAGSGSGELHATSASSAPSATPIEPIRVLDRHPDSPRRVHAPGCHAATA